MGANDLADMKVEETTLRRKLESTRDLSERRQIRALLRTLKEKREERQKEVEQDRINNNAPEVANKPPATNFDSKGSNGNNSKPANDPKVRFGNVDKPMERTDSGSNILELRSRRRSLAKPPPSTSFLMNKLSNVMQREKAAPVTAPGTHPKGVSAFRNKFEKIDANNNQGGPGNGSPAMKIVTSSKTRVTETSQTTIEKKGGVHFASTVIEKKEEHEISHPNRNALRSRRRSVAKLQVPTHVVEKPSVPLQNGPDVSPPDATKAIDNRFQRRLSRTRMTPNSNTGRFTPMVGKPGAMKPTAFDSPADRMAYFKQAADQENAKNEVKPTPPPPAAKPAPKPAPVATPPPPPPAQQQQQQNKENETEHENKPIQKIPRRSPPKKKPQLKRQMSVSQLVLQWCKDVTEEYEHVNITNFSGSFTDGLAMAALIHKFNPELFDYKTLIPGDRERNFTTAFQAAEKVGVAVLLDVEDLVRMKKPEPRSIQTQVQMIFSRYRPKDLDMSQLSIS